MLVADMVPASEVVPSASEAHAPLPKAFEWRAVEVLVGREREQAALRRAWKDVVEGEGCVLALAHGEAGVGKSRLIAAFAREVHDEGALVLLGRCEPGRHVPFEPVQSALRALVATAERSVLRGHVRACGGELLRIVPELATASTASRNRRLATPGASVAERRTRTVGGCPA